MGHRVARERLERARQRSRVPLLQHRREASIRLRDQVHDEPGALLLLRVGEGLERRPLQGVPLVAGGVPCEALGHGLVEAVEVRALRQGRVHVGDQGLVRLAVEAVRRGQDHAAGGEHERDQEAGREVEDREPAEAPVPPATQQGAGHQEGHVDAHRRRGRGDQDLLLGADDEALPQLGEARDRQVGGIGRSRLDQETQVRHQAAQDAAQGEAASLAHDRDHDAEEGQDDGAHEHAQHQLDRADALAAAAVGQHHRQGESQDDGAGPQGERSALPVGEEVLLHHAGRQGELGQGPDDVGHHHRAQPAPREHGAHLVAQGAEGVLAGREGHPADRAQGDHPERHGEDLHPQEVGARQDAQVERRGQGAAAEGDRALQPARPREADPGAEGRARSLRPGLGEQGLLARGRGGLGRCAVAHAVILGTKPTTAPRILGAAPREAGSSRHTGGAPGPMSQRAARCPTPRTVSPSPPPAS